MLKLRAVNRTVLLRPLRVAADIELAICGRRLPPVGDAAIRVCAVGNDERALHADSAHVCLATRVASKERPLLAVCDRALGKPHAPHLKLPRAVDEQRDIPSSPPNARRRRHVGETNPLQREEGAERNFVLDLEARLHGVRHIDIFCKGKRQPNQRVSFAEFRLESVLQSSGS